MALFETSAETRFIFQAMDKVPHGETITYESLSESIGRDVRLYATSALSSAITMQLKKQRVFECVRGVGYKLLTSKEIVRTQGDKALSHIKRTARRYVKRIASCVYDELNDVEKIRHNAHLSALGTINYLSKPAAINQIEQELKITRQRDLPIGNTLRLFIKNE